MREEARFGGLRAIALTHPTLAKRDVASRVVGDRRINRSRREHIFFDQQFPFRHRIRVIDIEHGNRSSANWR